ncbi:MAG: hypothetical protein PF694_14375 [Bacteroidetes bacterium]|nr:hypothetical protein [Bacteroidota bacterium]
MDKDHKTACKNGGQESINSPKAVQETSSGGLQIGARVSCDSMDIDYESNPNTNNP